MDQQEKKHFAEQSTWRRIAYMVLFVITFNVAEIVLAFVVGLQILFKLATGRPLDTMIELGREIGDYLRQVVNFLTFASDDMPYPISPWPSSSGKNHGSNDEPQTINL
jgi:hypothetical protein